MEFANVIDQVLDFRRDYPEAISILLAVVSFLAIGLVKFSFSSRPLSAEGSTLANMLMCKERWRWGVKGLNTKRGQAGTPTGNSLIYEANGVKVLAVLKSDKYSIDGEEIELSKSDKKQLRKLRQTVEAHLSAIDAANTARAQAKQRQARLNKLTNVA